MKKQLQTASFILAFIMILVSCKKNESQQGISLNGKSKLFAGDAKWDLLGYGYDMTGDPMALQNASDAPIIDMKRFEADYFNRINTPTSTSGKQYYYYGASANEYMKEVIKGRTFNASVTGGTKALDAKDDKDNYYFTGSLATKNTNQNTYNFSSKTSYARFEEAYKIKQIQFTQDVTLDLLKNYLTSEFLNNINNYTAEDLVERYGTHVLLDISIGGRLVFDFSASLVNETTFEKKTKSVEGALGFFVKKFGINISTTRTTEEMTKSFNESRDRKFGLEFYGGTNSGRSVSFDANGNSSETINIAGWEQSVNVNNAGLVNIERAAPIYEFISDPVKKQQVKNAVEKYISDRQIMLSPQEVYEFYNTIKGKHAYNLNPYMNLLFPSYPPNGQPFKAFSLPHNGAVPVYQFYNPKTEDHVMTTNMYPGWVGYNYDGILFYAYTTQVSGSVPVYEFYHSGSKDHVYSTNKNMIANFPGWQYTHIPFYSFQN
jgi:hypothetical protein